MLERAFEPGKLAKELLQLHLETAVPVIACWERAFLGEVAEACYLGSCLEHGSLRPLKVNSLYLRTNV